MTTATEFPPFAVAPFPVNLVRSGEGQQLVAEDVYLAE
jgi:hypothetical protein